MGGYCHCTPSLKAGLENKLDLPCRVRGGGDGAHASGTDGAGRDGELRMIQNIEELGAKLQIRFFKGNALGRRQVKIDIVWAHKAVARSVSPVVVRRNGEGSRVEPLRDALVR